MGDDFSALLEYRGMDAAVGRILTRLESGYEPPELTRVVELGKSEGFAITDRRSNPVRWFGNDDYKMPPPARPRLPDPAVYLGLQSGFFLHLGADTIWVYHLLRWKRFCEDRRWRDVMVPAVNWFRHAFGATDAVITWDQTAAVEAFGRGISFDRALQASVDDGEIDVYDPDDLYWLTDDSDLAAQTADGRWHRIMTIHWRGWWRPPRDYGRIT